MEIISKNSFKDQLKPLIFTINDNGLFSLSLAILNQIDFSNRYFWLTVFGYKSGIKKEWAIAFRFEFREMCVIEENGKENWFLPARFAIRRLTKDDQEQGKAFIELLLENKIDCPYNNLKEFVGFEIDNYETEFNINNFKNEKISCIASNGKSNKHNEYLEFKVIFDYPNYMITIQETDIVFRNKLFEYLLEK